MSGKNIKPKAPTKRHRRQPTKAIALGEGASARQSSALTSTGDFSSLIERVVAIIEEARSRVVHIVNSEMGQQAALSPMTAAENATIARYSIPNEPIWSELLQGHIRDRSTEA